MNYKNSPRAGGSANAGGYSTRPHYRNGAVIKQDRFPLCVLHNIRIVDGLPKGCPLRSQNPLLGVHEYEKRGYERLGREVDPTGGCNDLHRAETCWACISRLSSHPHIQRLRDEALGVNDAR